MSEQPKWTSGPWWCEPVGTTRPDAEGNTRYDLPRIVRYGDAGLSVCKAHLIGGSEPDRAIANAHLIAAAPGMATVLEYYADQFCEGFCKDLPQAGTYQPEMDLDCSGCKARAALAKARGQA